MNPTPERLALLRKRSAVKKQANTVVVPMMFSFEDAMGIYLKRMAEDMAQLMPNPDKLTVATRDNDRAYIYGIVTSPDYDDETYSLKVGVDLMNRTMWATFHDGRETPETPKITESKLPLTRAMVVPSVKLTRLMSQRLHLS